MPWMHVNNGRGEYFACEAESTHDGWRQAIAARPDFFRGASTCHFDISAAIDRRPGFHAYSPEAKGVHAPKPPYTQPLAHRRN